MQGIDTLRDKSRLVFFVDVEMEEARCRALTPSQLTEDDVPSGYK